MGAYRERLLVPAAYWLLAVPVVVLLGSEAWFLAGGFVPPLVIAVLAALVGTLLVHWSRATIEVADGVLRADRDTLALSQVAEVMALDERQARALRGPRADPSAHILLRPYLRFAVYIGLAEPATGAPYWLVATRHPVELAAAIEAARRSAAGPASPAGPQSGDRESVG
jgi:Protein of unknown function (DUF3093)